VGWVITPPSAISPTAAPQPRAVQLEIAGVRAGDLDGDTVGREVQRLLPYVVFVDDSASESEMVV
jgi:hypothetical protein